jgi:hypothetical protein
VLAELVLELLELVRAHGAALVAVAGREHTPEDLRARALIMFYS